MLYISTPDKLAFYFRRSTPLLSLIEDRSHKEIVEQGTGLIIECDRQLFEYQSTHLIFTLKKYYSAVSCANDRDKFMQLLAQKKYCSLLRVARKMKDRTIE